MTDKPPRRLAEHAKDFALRWADRLDQYAATRMEELGIPVERIGSSDHRHGIAWCAFNPYEGVGGGVSPDGRINLDGGLLNPGLMVKFGRKADAAWRRAAVRTRGDVIIAHEWEEGNGYSHDEAIVRAPDTELPISLAARELARMISAAHKAC
jgi:hypothetical protein